MGPLPVGTLLVKPKRHCLCLGDLTRGEELELGPLLRCAAACVQALAAAEQVYACLWSHAAWKPVHIHFVVQPAWARQGERFPAPGPTMQSVQFLANELPPRDEIGAFCDRVRAWPGWR